MMFSAAPFSAQPWSATGRDVRVYVDAFFDIAVSLELKIYVATCAGFATRPTDAIPNQPFRGVLKSLSFEQSIVEQDIGRFATGGGTLVISNADAEYDYLPISYSIDGRPITLKVGRRDAAYDDAFPLARLTARDWDINSDVISIDLVDFSYKLEVPMQPNVYGGTGGADGGPDIAGKRKPLVFGECKNITPVFLVPNLLIYQAHDGSMQAIDAVYDRGAGLASIGDFADYSALAAAAPVAGEFATCLSAGLFKLGIAANGTVTADVKGDKSDGYITTTADIARWALRRRTVLVDPDDLYEASFVALNDLQPAPIAYFIGPDDDLTVATFIENIMGGIGGWGGHRLDGTFEVRIFEAPTGAPTDSFTQADMTGGDIKREPLPEAYRPPRWRWRVPYARNWTVQTDLAGGVSAARKAFVAEAYRLAEASSEAIKLDHPFAQDRDPVQAYFVNQADAAAEADRSINLFKTTRAFYRMELPRRALRRGLGDLIQVTHPRFDLKQGRLSRVVSRRFNLNFEDRRLDSVELLVYG